MDLQALAALGENAKNKQQSDDSKQNDAYRRDCFGFFSFRR
jgi:hypothetical protein